MAGLIFFLSGFISIYAQTFLLREVQLVFHGNELSIGIILAVWLLGVSAGSRLSGLLKGRSRGFYSGMLAASFAAAGAYCCAAYAFIRYIRQLFGFFPGIGMPLAYLLYFSLIIFFPLGIVVGSQFGAGVRWLGEREKGFKSGAIYLWESLGFFAGGAVFTFAVLPGLSSAAAAVLLLQVSLAAAALASAGKAARTLFIAACAAVTAAYPAAGTIESYTLSKIYQGYRVAEVRNTPYGQLAAVERDDAKFFFSDGNPIETFNQPDTETIENNVFLPLLFRGDPGRVLLIGGTGREIPAILSYKVRELEYVELNPWLIDFVSRNVAGDVNARFTRAELKVHYADAVEFVKREGEPYDAIFIDLAYPVSLSLNRCYTLEFFRALSRRLAPGGIVSLSLPGSMNYVSPYLGAMNSSVYGALKGAFKYVRIVPGETYLYVAGGSPLPESEAVADRFGNKIASAYFLSGKYIRYKLDPGKEKWLVSELAKYPAPANREYSPSALYRSLLYWQSVFSPSAAGFLKALASWSWALALAAFLLIVLTKPGYSAQSFSSGAAAMGLQIAYIWSFQVSNGSVYYWIGLLNAVFMAGAGVGAWYSKRYGRRGGAIALSDLAFLLWIGISYAAVRYAALPGSAVFVFSAAAGLLLGFQFPLLAPAEAARSGGTEEETAGKIYAYDVMGGAAAALIGGALIIPAYGLSGLAASLALVKAASFAAVRKRA